MFLALTAETRVMLVDESSADKDVNKNHQYNYSIGPCSKNEVNPFVPMLSDQFPISGIKWE